MMSKRHNLASFLVVTILGVGVGVGVPAVSLADDAAEAERLFREGMTAAEQGDLAGAALSFEASFRLNPVPEVAYNLAMCRQELGDYPGAANAFREFAAALGTRITPEQAAEVEAHLGELIPQIGRLTVEVAEDGADITVDGVHVGTTPLGPWVAVVPGRHQVTATKPGFVEASTTVVVLAGGTAPVALTLVAASTDAAGEDSGISPWFWASVGVTAAAGVGMAITGGLTLKSKDEYLDGGHTDEGLYDDIVTLRTTTDVLLGVTVAGAIAATLVFFMVGDEEAPEDDGASDVGAMVLPAGVMVWW